jgi:hypothetical protein
MDKVISRDGTPIAIDRLGDGPPVIVVCGAMCDRALTRLTAEELAKHLTVFNYDRRSWGDSGARPLASSSRECSSGAPSELDPALCLGIALSLSFGAEKKESLIPIDLCNTD